MDFMLIICLQTRGRYSKVPLGGERDSMDKRLDEQNYLWLMRAFTVFGAVSALLAVVLIFGFLAINPGHKWDAFFVAFRNPEDRTMYVNRINDMAITQDSVARQLAENLITSYVVARESGNFSANSEVAYMSSPEVRRVMLAGRKPESGGLNVSIAPNGIQYHSRLDLWEIEVLISGKGEKHKPARRRIEVKARFEPGTLERRGAAKWLNPLGLVVSSYRIMSEV